MYVNLDRHTSNERQAPDVNQIEVLAITAREIILHSPYDTSRFQKPVISDILYEVTAQVKAHEGVAEFTVKTVMCPRISQDLDKQGRPLHPGLVIQADFWQRRFSRAAMEAGARNCKR